MSIARGLCIFVFMAILLATTAFAGGFQLNEHGAKGMAQAGAFAARATDGSALYFNPAGLGFQNNASVYAGATLIIPSTAFYGPLQNNSNAKSELKKQYFNPINVYVVYPIFDGLTAGIGVNNPYGLGTEWPEDWAGRFLTTKVDLKTFFYSGALSYRVMDNLSVGAGFSYVDGSVTLSRKVPVASVATPVEPTVNLDLKGTGTGFNVGVIYKPTTAMSIGLSYRSSVKITADGTAEFTPNYAALNFPGGDASAALELPATGFAGISYKVTDELELEADYQYIGWSSYDQLKVDFKKNNSSSISPKNYQDTYIIRVGGEYDLGCLKLRGGYYYDHSPVKTEYLEPLLPDASRHGLNAGFGYQITKHFNVDVSYLFITFLDRKAENTIPEISFDGTYKTHVNLIGVDLGYTF
jgi:long-chain fatty acid transport protein